jgi:hypothetical protein
MTDGAGAWAAIWDFYPGVNATCTFSIYIPKSSAVTDDNVTYQAWATIPGQHKDQDRIDGNQTVDQGEAARQGGVITITFGPTKTDLLELQLLDDTIGNKVEVAGQVTATCS